MCAVNVIIIRSMHYNPTFYRIVENTFAQKNIGVPTYKQESTKTSCFCILGEPSVAHSDNIRDELLMYND